MPKRSDVVNTPAVDEVGLNQQDQEDSKTDIEIEAVLGQLGEMIASLNDKIDATLVTVSDEVSAIHKEIDDINAAIFDIDEEDTKAEKDLVHISTVPLDALEEDQEEDTEEEIKEAEENIIPDIGIPCIPKIPKKESTGKTPGCTDILNPFTICTTLTDFLGNIVSR